MKVLAALYLFIIVLLSSACSDYWTIQRSEGFVNEKNKDTKIICISPMITYQNKEQNRELISFQKKLSRFEKSILRSAKKNHIQLELQTLTNNANINFYDKLLLLRQEVYDVNFDTYSSLNSTGNGMENKLTKSIYVYAPKISHDFNNYSKLFGAKYFSFIKIIVSSESFSFNHVLIDTDLSETVYSERKTINHSFNQAICDQVVYDSFAALNKELKM